MKTIKQDLIEYLENLGIFQSQAKPIIELASKDINKFLEEESKMLESSGGYPKAVYDILFAIIKPHGLKWFKENKPEAWCIPIFK